jgi:hypothetical protein
MLPLQGGIFCLRTVAKAKVCYRQLFFMAALLCVYAIAYVKAGNSLLKQTIVEF